MKRTYYQPGGGLPHLSSVADVVQSNQPISDIVSSPMFWVWNVGHFVSVPTLAYHGYRRNDSVGWAVVWGLFGSFVWPITVPIAFAQGFAKRRVSANSRRRRRTSRRTSRRSHR
jgi:hypothetical protein